MLWNNIKISLTTKITKSLTVSAYKLQLTNIWFNEKNLYWNHKIHSPGFPHYVHLLLRKGENNWDSLHKTQRKQTRKAYLRGYLKDPMKRNEMLINHILKAVLIKS